MYDTLEENESDSEAEIGDDISEAVPEPELDAQLEKAYALEKEDANSGDEGVASGSDEDVDSVKNDETKEPLAKKQKRQDEVYLREHFLFCFSVLK